MGDVTTPEEWARRFEARQAAKMAPAGGASDGGGEGTPPTAPPPAPPAEYDGIQVPRADLDKMRVGVIVTLGKDGEFGVLPMLRTMSLLEVEAALRYALAEFETQRAAMTTHRAMAALMQQPRGLGPGVRP